MFKRVISSLLLLLFVSSIYPAETDTFVPTGQSYERLLISSDILLTLYEDNLEELTKLLTANKQYINFQYEPDNATLLIKATENNNVKAVRCLVNLGADVDICNNEGQSAITLAHKNNFKDIEEILTAKKIIESKNHGEKRRNTDDKKFSEERSQKEKNEREKKRKLESIPFVRPTSTSMQSGEPTLIDPTLVYCTLIGTLPTSTSSQELPLAVEPSSESLPSGSPVETSEFLGIPLPPSVIESNYTDLSSDFEPTEETEAPSSNIHICTEEGCGKKFNNLQWLNLHLKKEHEILQERNKKGRLIKPCNYCGIKIDHTNKGRHVRSHTFKTPFICKEGACGSNPERSYSYFKSEKSLINHKGKAHKKKSSKEQFEGELKASRDRQEESKEVKEEVEQSADESQEVPVITMPAQSLQSQEDAIMDPGRVYTTLTGSLPTTTSLPDLPLPDLSEILDSPLETSGFLGIPVSSSIIESNKLICTICGLECKNETGLNIHLTKTHKISQEKNHRGRMMRPCVHCEKKFVTSYINTHEKRCYAKKLRVEEKARKKQLEKKLKKSKGRRQEESKEEVEEQDLNRPDLPDASALPELFPGLPMQSDLAEEASELPEIPVSPSDIESNSEFSLNFNGEL